MEANIQELASIDGQTLFGVPIQQTWTALYMLEKLIVEQNIGFVAELGTGHGALKDYFNLTVNMCESYDLPDWDVFDERTKKRVKWFIDNYYRNQPAMIFCDGGDKPREIREYAPALKRGDFILGHDYRRPGGIPENFDIESLGLETYNQDDWDRMKTYILCLRKK